MDTKEKIITIKTKDEKIDIALNVLYPVIHNKLKKLYPDDKPCKSLLLFIILLAITVFGALVVKKFIGYILRFIAGIRFIIRNKLYVSNV